MIILIGCSSGRRITPPDVLRFATLHIDHGMGSDGRVDVKRISHFLETIDADVVALQGVDRGTVRSETSDQIALLAEALDKTYTYGRVSRLESGETGNAILTRFPIIEERHVESDSHRGLAAFMLVVLERRGQELVIVNTDLGRTGSPLRWDVTLQEIERSTDRFSTAPLIVCGFDEKRSENKPFADRWKEIVLADEEKRVSGSRHPKEAFVMITRRSVESGSIQISAAETMVDGAPRFLPLIVEFRIKTD